MKNTTILAASLAVSASGAFAAGFDRSGQSIDPLFEDGSYLEFSFGVISPDTSGTQRDTLNPAAEGLSSGDVTDTFTQIAGAVKFDISDRLSFGLIIDQPFGADVNYAGADLGYIFADANATVDTASITSILRYKLDDRFSIHGGIRSTRTSGEVSIPSIAGYSLETSTEQDFSYLIGAAYEIPEIALRLAVTYNSEIDIDFDSRETSLLGDVEDSFDVTLPQSVNVDFQTGIAADTLLTASLRWVDWTSTAVTTDTFSTLTGGSNIVSYEDDTITYSVGLARRFNDKWAGSFSIGYEESVGGTAANLGPTDGLISVSLGAEYQLNETTAIAGGITYVEIGNAETNLLNAGTGEFDDNSAIGAGFRISHNF